MCLFTCTDPNLNCRKMIRLSLTYSITTESQKNSNLKHSFYLFNTKTYRLNSFFFHKQKSLLNIPLKQQWILMSDHNR